MATKEKALDPKKADAPKSELAQITKNPIVNMTMTKIKQLEADRNLQLPPNYSAVNSLIGGYLILQQTVDKDGRSVLQTCTPESIVNALLDMVVQGLSPSKRQVYFIAYGQKLVCQRSYFGTVTLARRLLNATGVYAEVVYQDDDFEFEIVNANTVIRRHGRTLEGMQADKIVAAYCVIERPDLPPYAQVMSIKQIHESWRKSRQSPFDDKGNVKAGTVHGQFPEEMAKRTVTNRTCKVLINSTMDDTLDVVVERMNRAEDAADEAAFEVTVADAPIETIDVPTPALPDNAPPAPADPKPAAKATKPTQTEVPF